jgi:hypothetical protein
LVPTIIISAKALSRFKFVYKQDQGFHGVYEGVAVFEVRTDTSDD